MVEVSMLSEMGPVLLRVDLVPMRRSSVFVTVEFEGIEGQPCFYCRDAGFELGEGRIVGEFGADVDQGVVSVAVDVQVEVADDVTEGEEVADEKKGAED